MAEGVARYREAPAAPWGEQPGSQAFSSAGNSLAHPQQPDPTASNPTKPQQPDQTANSPPNP